MIKLYGMTVLALVCASSISVDAGRSATRASPLEGGRYATGESEEPTPALVSSAISLF